MLSPLAGEAWSPSLALCWGGGGRATPADSGNRRRTRWGGAADGDQRAGPTCRGCDKRRCKIVAYYELSGSGTITLGQETHPLRPGSVAVIPAGVLHSLEAEPGQQLEFVIFGTPPMTMDDERAKPVKPVG